jgi:RNA polymerase sigma factor (sigma-70 family)
VVSAHIEVEDLLRALAPQVLTVLVRRHGDFADAEDAVQEALIAAATQWPADGVPANPRGWLLAVAGRRLTDAWRADVARRHREDLVATREPTVPARPSDEDDSLVLLFLCCHPMLTPGSAIPLTLRAVGGLSTAEIAAAFLVPEDTMAKRISRAKQRIRTSGVPFRMPTPVEWNDRLRSVLHVLYLIFNEGYAASTGPHVVRVDLSTEAIRLTRAMHSALPDEPEVAGLLTLMLLTDARRPARTGPAGELVPLAEQDRTRWDRDLITEGIALLSSLKGRGRSRPTVLSLCDRFCPFPARCGQTPARGPGQGSTGGRPAQAGVALTPTLSGAESSRRERVWVLWVAVFSSVRCGRCRQNRESGCRSSLRHRLGWHGVVRPQPGRGQSVWSTTPPGGGQTANGLASWLRRNHAHAGRARQRI